MSKTILPKHLKEKILKLFDQDHSTIEIFDLVCSEAMSYVDSHEHEKTKGGPEEGPPF